jgi:hypothetical protein
MEQLADGREARPFDGDEAGAAQARGVGHLGPAGGAAAQVGGEVKALHRADYPARVRPGSRPLKWKAPLRKEAFTDGRDRFPGHPDRGPGSARRRARDADGQRHPRPRHGRGAAGQFRPPRGADGHGRDRRRAAGTGTCATTRRTRAGPAATASSCPTATARCCSTRCCTSPATTSRSERSATSASCTARRRAIPRSTSPPASRRRPARSARA